MKTRIDHLAPGRIISRGFVAALALSLGLLLAMTAPTDAANDYPLTLIDDEGTEVTIEAAPQRIISLSPANTEIVFALGAGGRLVGGTDFDDYPAEAATLTDVATFSGVIREQVVDLEPDLVLAAGNSFTNADDIAWLRESGYPVLVIYAPDVETVLADIELIGTSIGEATAAEAMTARMAARIDAVAAAAAATETTPRTYYELDWFDGSTYGPAPESFVADMVVLAGGDAITTGDPVLFEMPLEQLVIADPEIIVLGDAMFGVCPADVAARAGWSGMAAVVNGDVRPVDGLTVTRPGPRLADGLTALALAIHPDLELAEVVAAAPLCAAA